MFIPPNDDDTITDVSFSVNKSKTTTSPIILPTLPPIIDTGLVDINTNDTDNSAHSIHEIQNDVNNTKCMNKGTNSSTNGAVTNTKEKSVLMNESKKLKSISDVYKSFQLPKSTRSCIPTLTDLRNESNLNEKNHAKWTGLVNMSMNCLDQVLAAYVQDQVGQN